MVSLVQRIGKLYTGSLLDFKYITPSVDCDYWQKLSKIMIMSSMVPLYHASNQTYWSPYRLVYMHSSLLCKKGRMARKAALSSSCTYSEDSKKKCIFISTLSSPVIMTAIKVVFRGTLSSDYLGHITIQPRNSSIVNMLCGGLPPLWVHMYKTHKYWFFCLMRALLQCGVCTC